MSKEEFLTTWKVTGAPPLELAQALGIDPVQAFSWIRQHREAAARRLKQALPLPPREVLERAIRLAARARELVLDPEASKRLTPDALVALTRLGGLLEVLEEGWASLEVHLEAAAE